jgi:hypothetical protein
MFTRFNQFILHSSVTKDPMRRGRITFVKTDSKSDIKKYSEEIKANEPVIKNIMTNILIVMFELAFARLVLQFTCPLND